MPAKKLALTPEQAYYYALTIPSGYAEGKLQLKLHPTQAKVVDALFDSTVSKPKIAFKCGNEVGKTSHVAVTAILYALEMLDCVVVSTAATYRQITKQLIPNLKQHANLYPKWEFLDNAIKINGEPRYTGFSTSEDSKFQGFHNIGNKKLLIIVDESAGVDDEIFQSIARCNPDYLLIMGSPLGPEGFFYSVCTEPNTMKPFKHFTLTKLDCVKSKGYWLEDKDIQDFIAMWGNDNPLVLSSVYAEFATNIVDGIITLAEIEKNIRNFVLPDTSGGKHVAIDFAAGGAENVITLRNGNVITIIKAWKEKDTMKAAYEIVNELNILKEKYNITSSDVSGDADGLGIPIIDRLKELGWDINRFHGGSQAIDNTTYSNKITECWLSLARKIRSSLIQIPNDQELKLQLTSRKQLMNSNGKLKLEAKADMSARGIPSPDRADAVAMCASNPFHGLLTDIKTYLPPARQYKGYF